jgi:hypothetical protein
MDGDVVVAFPESPALRETLAVLLERDCRLRFLRTDTLPLDECRTASVALVAVARPERVLQDLRQHCPALPIVDVDVTGERRADEPSRRDDRVFRVPLEPHAIRGAVLRQLVADSDVSLRATARVIGETLRSDVSYAGTALRSFSALHASSAGPDTYALLGAVMREQSYVLGETVDQLQRFRSRPRAAAMSREFSAALCQQLQRHDHRNGERALLCQCVIDATCQDPGPVELVPTVAGFLRVHLRRTADTAVVHVRLTPDGVSLRYRRRHSSAKIRSWPLLLVALALEPWSWSVSTMVDDEQEVVRLRRAARMPPEPTA